MWRRFQPNPFNISTSDCTVRAVCAVTGLDWRTAHRILCELSGELGEMPDRNRSWWAFLRAIGFTQFRLIDTCPDCYTVEDFADEHPHGVYVVGTGNHVVTIVDGTVFDSWDSRREIVSYFWSENETEE